MKLLFVSLLSALFLSIQANAQKKVKLYFKLSATVDASDDIMIYGTQPPYDRKAKVASIDSLINYKEINSIIKSQDYKGVRILSELDLIGWKLEASIPLALKQYADPRIIFLLSREYEINKP